jgi:hypothetical protein
MKLSVPACPDGSNDRLALLAREFVTFTINNSLLPSGQAETESEYQVIFCVVASQLLIPLGQAQRKSVPPQNRDDHIKCDDIYLA